MEKIIQVTEKYERNGWPSLPRPDQKNPPGWDLSLVTAQERIRNHHLSSDGQTIAFIKDNGYLSDIFCLSSNGGWPARVTTNRRLVAYWDDEIPQWSPDNQHLAFCIDGHVFISSDHGRSLPKKITDFSDGAGSPRWMPDSNGLIVSITRHEADQLVLTDINGSWPTQLTNSADGDHWDARVSPDGKKIAYTFRPFNDLNRLDICLIDLKSGTSSTLYGKSQTRAHEPRWSSDGKWIAFICQENGHDDLWMVHPDGEGLQQITGCGCDIVQFDWHPKHMQILASINRAGAFDLALIDISSGEISNLRNENGIHGNPQWSKNGAFFTFEFESPLQPPEIYRMDMKTRSVTQLTSSFIPALAANKLVPPEEVRYKSFDGMDIPAFLYRPAKPNGAAVLYPHGGPSGQSCLEWDILAQYLVAKGYTYIAPNYRGSTGYGLAFEHANYNDWGVGDTKDCLFGAKYLASLPWIDPARLAIMGGSYGGYMTNCCLSRDPEYLFACGIAKYGDANTVSSWALCKRELRLYTEIFLGHPAKNRGIYRDSCPIYDAANVQKPILLLHGLEDDVVPPEASEEWASALRENGKTFEYKTYAGEPHGFLRRENLLDVYSRIERFLDWYLMP
ncbi:MAG: S9 family peptidase [Chloroflexota bacterium]